MNNDPMRLFWHRSSSASLRVMMYRALRGVPDDVVELVHTGLTSDERGILVYTLPEGDAITRELGTIDLKALNPEGRIPILLMADGRRMTQSGAIIDLIDAQLDGPNPMVPQDVWLQAEMRRIMWIIAADVQPYQNIPFIIQAMTEWGMVQAKPTEHPLRLHFIRREFAALEGILATCAGTCAVGDDVTLADCFLIPQVRNALLAGIDLNAEFPVMARVWNHVIALPPVAALIEDAGGIVQQVTFDDRKFTAKAALDG